MTTLARRDDTELTRGFTDWCARHWPDAGYEIARLDRPNTGWTNETLLVTLRDRHAGEQRVVVRLPPAVPTWPVYDLAAQARLLEVLAPEAVPVPELVAYEPDDRWIGAPFLVMAHAVGRPGAEAPALDEWVTGSTPELQRALHEGFLAALAAIHAVDWRASGLVGVLRGSERFLADEVAWWVDYVEWAGDGSPTRALAEAAAWCASTAPVDAQPPASLCWGDARVGNVMFAEDRSVTTVLDWELATIGPAEMDLAWYLALDELTTRFVKRTVPGFLARAEFVARYEAALGRAVVDLEWHEIFALVRSTAINDRQARLAAESGVAYPGVAGDGNPVLRVIGRRIETYDDRGKS